MAVKVSSVNVNGIRSACSKGLVDWIVRTAPDIVCFQELKALDADIPKGLADLGYFQWYHPAEKKGYSGVGVMSKIEPKEVRVGTGIDWIDREGRVLTLDFGDWNLCSVYAPSGTTGELRQNVKYEFLDAFSAFGDTYLQSKRPIVFVGDMNIAHQEIDIHNPVANRNTSGFLPEERAWFTRFLEQGFVDVFRHLNPGLRDVYSWWSFRAGSRARNKGWRIDYHLASADLQPRLLEAFIETDLVVSDHAPVTALYDL